MIVVPEYMKVRDGDMYYYLSDEDSVELNRAIAEGNEKVATLLIQIAAESREAHCASKY